MANIISLSAAREQRNLAVLNTPLASELADTQQASLTWFMTRLDDLVGEFESTDHEHNLMQVNSLLAQLQSFRRELNELEDMAIFLKDLSLQHHRLT